MPLKDDIVAAVEFVEKPGPWQPDVIYLYKHEMRFAEFFRSSGYSVIEIKPIPRPDNAAELPGSSEEDESGGS